MERDLYGQVALITGSDSGIGQATAAELARRGANVVVTYHNDPDGGEETVRSVEQMGAEAIALPLDTREESSVDELFDKAIERFGHVDILVNNAGVDSSGKPVHEMDTETWDNAIRTNLYGYFFCARRFVREYLKNGNGIQGKMVFVTSVHAEHPRVGAADYDASKAGERLLAKTLALELAEKNIRVVNVAPGWILTPFNEPDMEDEETYRQHAQSVPMKRAAAPEEIAKAIAFVVSDEAAYMTGTTMTVDGGLSINQGQGA